MATGTVKTVFYKEYPNIPNKPKVYASGEIEDNNNQNKYKFNFLVEENAILVRDIVDFNTDKDKATNVVFKKAPIIELDNPDVILKIKEANYVLSITQMKNPNIRDKKGYSNDKFRLGIQLNHMWNEKPFVDKNKDILLQVTSSLLVGHIEQGKKISTLLNEKYYNDILPYYKKLQDTNILYSIRKRGEILKNKFLIYPHNRDRFYFNYINMDNETDSLIIYTYNENKMRAFIQDCNLLTFTKTDIQKEDHCYFFKENMNNQIINSIEINRNILEKNLALRNYISKSKVFFDEESQYINLINNTQFSNNESENNLITKKKI